MRTITQYMRTFTQFMRTIMRIFTQYMMIFTQYMKIFTQYMRIFTQYMRTNPHQTSFTALLNNKNGIGKREMYWAGYVVTRIRCSRDKKSAYTQKIDGGQ